MKELTYFISIILVLMAGASILINRLDGAVLCFVAGIWWTLYDYVYVQSVSK